MATKPRPKERPDSHVTGPTRDERAQDHLRLEGGLAESLQYLDQRLAWYERRASKGVEATSEMLPARHATLADETRRHRAAVARPKSRTDASRPPWAPGMGPSK